MKEILKARITKAIKGAIKPIALILLLIVLVMVILGVFDYQVTTDDATYNEGDDKNAPYVVSEFINNVYIDENGKLVTSKSVKELWDEMIKNNNRVRQYLKSPEELKKLITAEMVTQYPDLRSNPDEPIDWEALNDPEIKEVQGVVKFKRADENGNITTLTYVGNEEYEQLIENYNSSGSEADRKEALSHFTFEKSTSVGYSTASTQTTENKDGTAINIPEGYGAIHKFMSWQSINDTTSSDYQLREKAGMKFDSEGFGVINGRYVIECTTAYGKIGDYIDFYQDDGTIIPCIIGHIKNQNDEGCNKWGDLNGTCIINFIVDKDKWYNPMHANPGTSNCHPEWNKNLTKAINGGNYFDNSNIGADKITEKYSNNSENNSNENSQTENSENSNDENNGATISDGLMHWPVPSKRITSGFGPRNTGIKDASTNHKRC